MNYLLEQGKIAIRVRKHLRGFLNAQDQKNNFINELLEAEYKRSDMELDKPLATTDRANPPKGAGVSK
jgi:hypothetical protein